MPSNLFGGGGGEVVGPPPPFRSISPMVIWHFFDKTGHILLARVLKVPFLKNKNCVYFYFDFQIHLAQGVFMNNNFFSKYIDIGLKTPLKTLNSKT